MITQNEKEIENIRVNGGGSVEEWWRWTDGWGCWLPRECEKVEGDGRSCGVIVYNVLNNIFVVSKKTKHIFVNVYYGYGRFCKIIHILILFC